MIDEAYTSEERTFGMLCHLTALAGYIIPFGNIIGPLICWLIKKDDSEFVDYHGKESLNFQISMMIYALVAGFLCCFVIGFVFVPIIIIMDLVLPIIAGVKASNGEYYVYPMCIRFIS